MAGTVFAAAARISYPSSYIRAAPGSTESLVGQVQQVRRCEKTVSQLLRTDLDDAPHLIQRTQTLERHQVFQKLAPQTH